MVRNEGFSAVTAIIKNPTGVVFNPSTGIPLVVYYCTLCGYVELYTAHNFPEWNAPPPSK
jgi:hypothetical protein